jgi:arylsulfatase A-like enzyme
MIKAGPGIEKGAIDDRVTSLLDLSATILDLTGADPLPNSNRQVPGGPRPLVKTAQRQAIMAAWMNIKTPALRQRMLRRDHLKICVYDGHAPTAL